MTGGGAAGESGGLGVGARSRRGRKAGEEAARGAASGEDRNPELECPHVPTQRLTGSALLLLL